MDKTPQNNESVRRQLLALEQMTQEELTEKRKDLFGAPPRHNMAAFLCVNG